MSLAFTVCSNNFLAQAKTLFNSLYKFEPQLKCFLFLSDKKSADIDYRELQSATVVEIDEQVVPGFSGLVAKYTLFELNSILKPFLFQWLIKEFPAAAKIFYIDADVCFYDDLHEAGKALDEYDIVVTPHFLTPVPDDGLEPFENSALNFGTYNLGFLAINTGSQNTKDFLAWWGNRTRNYGHYDIVNGLFVDQIWLNLAPIFFKRVLSFRHSGYNMAAWNLHERKIASVGEDGKISLANGDSLVFYHFSSYDPARPDLLSLKYNRHDFSNSPHLRKLYDNYAGQLKENGIEKYSRLPCTLPVRKEKKPGPIRKILHPGVNVLKKAWRKL